jgi:hypothetical protein
MRYAQLTNRQYSYVEGLFFACFLRLRSNQAACRVLREIIAELALRRCRLLFRVRCILDAVVSPFAFSASRLLHFASGRLLVGRRGRYGAWV